MTIKIVGLAASPRPQGNTLRLLKYFMQQCQALGAQTSILTAFEHPVECCRGCETCMRQGTCPLPDDYLPLLPQVLAADAVVIASPNYAFGISAQLKALMDRSHAFLYYQQALRGKYGVGLCVGGHWFRTRALAKWCGQTVWICGGSHVGSLAAVSKCRDKKGFVHEDRVYAQADRMAHRLVRAVTNRKSYWWQNWFREAFVVKSLWRGLVRRKKEYPWIAGQIEKQMAGQGRAMDEK